MVKRKMGSSVRVVRIDLPNGDYYHLLLSLDDNEKAKKTEQEEGEDRYNDKKMKEAHPNPIVDTFEDRKEEKLRLQESHPNPNVDMFEDINEEELRLQEALYYSISSISKDESKKALEKQVCDYKKKGVVTSFPHDTSIQYGASPSSREIGECSHNFCAICANAKSSGSMIRSDSCNHCFCEDCIVIYVAEQTQENIREVKCPESKCKGVLELKIFEHLIPKEVVYRWKSALCEVFALGTPMVIRCPFRDCGGLFMDDKRGFLIRACPNCWKLFCVRCMDKWHLGMTCRHYQIVLMKKMKMRQARLREWRRRGMVFVVDDDDDDDDDDGDDIIRVSSKKNV